MCDLPERDCEPINDAVEIHFWPVTDPPVGTPCKCGKTTRRPPRWLRETSRANPTRDPEGHPVNPVSANVVGLAAAVDALRPRPKLAEVRALAAAVRQIATTAAGGSYRGDERAHGHSAQVIAAMQWRAAATALERLPERWITGEDPEEAPHG